jgi:2-keto-4-pentenoate hydratase/2-oxohepta-3-ene-1,7-dioic acid hydratase in catechol pathway
VNLLSLLQGAPRPTGAAIPLSSIRLRAPVPQPGKLVCIGLNYRDHCIEQNIPVPERPIIFSKFSSSIADPFVPVLRPPETQQLDFEAELAVVIGTACRDVPLARALDHVFGYTIFNDISARDLQFGDSQWTRGKSFPTFGPMGPWITTADEVGDPQTLSIKTYLNHKVVQDSSTAQMVFGVAELVSYVSRLGLDAGDVIVTGTPAGVGVFRKPPIFLQPRDEVEIEIERLGSLVNPIADADLSPLSPKYALTPG